MFSNRIRSYIRQNVLGLVAVFIALSGTAHATHPGGTNTISTDDIQNQAVTTPKLANNAVNTQKLNTNAVKTESIANSAVTSVKLADLAVSRPKLADLAVTRPKLASSAVNSSKVADGSLTGNDIDESTLDLGLGFYTGRLSDLPTDPLVQAKGAPSGVTATPDISVGLESPYATLSPNRPTASGTFP